MVKYEEFKIFHDKHPDLDNNEYYAEFTDTNKSTIRSWKLKARKPEIIDDIEPTVPDKPEDYDELQNYLITSLMTQTNTKAHELEGLDNKNKIMVLNNRVKALNEDKVREPNSSILPAPRPKHITHKKFGLDDYIEFDKVKGEIRMEIPCDVLFDPEKNKGLGLIK